MNDESTVSGEEEAATIRQYATDLPPALPDGYEIGDDHGRMVHVGRYNAQVVEMQLSGDEEDGAGFVQLYIPDDWMVGDDHGRLVHVKRYNSRAIEPKQEGQ
jgi:hypothetical protein